LTKTAKRKKQTKLIKDKNKKRQRKFMRCVYMCVANRDKNPVVRYSHSDEFNDPTLSICAYVCVGTSN